MISSVKFLVIMDEFLNSICAVTVGSWMPIPPNLTGNEISFLSKSVTALPIIIDKARLGTLT